MSSALLLPYTAAILLIYLGFAPQPTSLQFLGGSNYNNYLLQQRYIQQQQLQQQQQQLLLRAQLASPYQYVNPALSQGLAAAIISAQQNVFTTTPDPLLASCLCGTPICQHQIPNNRTYCQSACPAEVGSCVVRCTSCSQAEGSANAMRRYYRTGEFEDMRESDNED